MVGRYHMIRFDRLVIVIDLTVYLGDYLVFRKTKDGEVLSELCRRPLSNPSASPRPADYVSFVRPPPHRLLPLGHSHRLLPLGRSHRLLPLRQPRRLSLVVLPPCAPPSASSA